MKSKTPSMVLVLVLAFSTAYAQSGTEAFSKLPSNQQQSLTRRLGEYVQAYRTRDWKKLYDLVSDTGKKGVNQQVFVAAMKAKHGRKGFSGMPDLLAFTPARSGENEDGLDIYGCGKAKREGETYTGIAVIHAVPEQGTWTFSGWSFTEFPNEPCSRLKDPNWTPQGQMEWRQPMEELRTPNACTSTRRP
jgi:hypothetical protein